MSYTLEVLIWFTLDTQLARPAGNCQTSLHERLTCALHLGPAVIIQGVQVVQQESTKQITFQERTPRHRPS
jgi:hypothetical protein